MMTLEKLKELVQKSTRVVAWYAHSQYDGYHPGKASVRGPFGRWFLVEGGSNGMGDEIKHPTPVADLYDDAKFAAAAMNSVAELIERNEKLTDALEFYKKRDECITLEASPAKQALALYGSDKELKCDG